VMIDLHLRALLAMRMPAFAPPCWAVLRTAAVAADLLLDFIAIRRAARCRARARAASHCWLEAACLGRANAYAIACAEWQRDRSTPSVAI
jgi:hypothetical protein